MSNIDDLDFNPDDESVEDFGYTEEVQALPHIVAYLDQQQEDWQQRKEDFARYYGFEHTCNCSDDYAKDRVESVTQCFIRLCSEALDRCVEATSEIALLTIYLGEMLQMNNDLTEMLKANGHEEELEEYMNREVDFEAYIEGDEQEQLMFPDEWDEMEREDDDGEEEFAGV